MAGRQAWATKLFGAHYDFIEDVVLVFCGLANELLATCSEWCCKYVINTNVDFTWTFILDVLVYYSIKSTVGRVERGSSFSWKP